MAENGVSYCQETRCVSPITLFERLKMGGRGGGRKKHSLFNGESTLSDSVSGRRSTELY